MKNKKFIRTFTVLIAALVVMCGFSRTCSNSRFCSNGTVCRR